MHVRVPNLAKTGILVADTQFLKEALSVHPSIRPLVMFESKSGKTSIWILLVYDCVWGMAQMGCGWGLDTPAHSWAIEQHSNWSGIIVRVTMKFPKKSVAETKIA